MDHSQLGNLVLSIGIIIFAAHVFTAMFQKTAVLGSTANLPNYEARVPIYKLLILNTFYYLKDQRYDWVQFGQPANRSLVSGFDNYCLPGDIPKFKIYDASEDKIYCTQSTEIIPPWEYNDVEIVNGLFGFEYYETKLKNIVTK